LGGKKQAIVNSGVLCLGAGRKKVDESEKKRKKIFNEPVRAIARGTKRLGFETNWFRRSANQGMGQRERENELVGEVG